ncbi:MAG TPA: 2-oxoacid:acceptor oxidoreductase family protein, partial [Pseudomonas nitrititolerans]|nr:2-oxoacid:acceptor oxidoreductase family protein [Stutzerimonas nitrititolerans]
FVTVHGGQLRKPEAVADGIEAAELPEPQHPSLERPWNVLIPGVGGSGVTTLGALIGMAAHLEGKGCTVLDQAGLAQKFGPVTTHVRIAARQSDIYAVRIAAGEADLLLGCDLIVAAGDEALTRLNDRISNAVVNSFEGATAEFTRNPDAQVPGAAMRQAIADAVGAEKTHFVDATRLATRLMGDSIATNLFLLGFAYQQGLLPVSAEAIEKAIGLNDVSTELNRQAFRWGRRAVLERDAVERLARPVETAEPSLAGPICKTLEEIVDWRVDFLTQYQNADLARRYRYLVERVREADTADDLALSKAVAHYYFKLLAYKDEYEVARLYSEPEFRQQLETQFEGDYRLQFHLAPAWLAKVDPKTGEPRKREFGPWMLDVFGVLAKLRFLRGTPLDPFGYGHDRRVERQLIADYEKTVDDLLAKLKPTNYRTAVAIAALPELIRGYGPVKERAIAKTRQQEKVLREQLDKGDEVQSVRLFQPAA